MHSSRNSVKQTTTNKQTNDNKQKNCTTTELGTVIIHSECMFSSYLPLFPQDTTKGKLTCGKCLCSLTVLRSGSLMECQASKRHLPTDSFITQQLPYNCFCTPTVNGNFRQRLYRSFPSFLCMFLSSVVRCRDLQSCLVTLVEVLLAG